ncbi:hypothetical protein JS532_01610 [Bifidobacterium callimiconis]|uniref:hypothetical protein n=1 Tax=Bifidobacterium callimiconis TaxID=2306973 RepID=UPI001BDBF5C3|nr:hypothetical protein [Bifidobacterium callimiconis]MBT1176261.1 hypothetical protein [Bifidobacterium callimiconis]
MKRANRTVAALVCVMTVFAMAGCGQSGDSKSNAESSQSTQAASEQMRDDWEQALETAGEARNELSSALQDAQLMIKDAASTDDSATLQSVIDKTQKVYSSTSVDSDLPDSDAASYQSATDKLNKASTTFTDQNAALAAAIAAYRAKLPAMSYTITSNEGYTYGVKIAGLNMSASVDTTKGDPGTVAISYRDSGVTHFTITNTTAGKKAPLNWEDKDTSITGYFGTVEPLYSTNPCSSATGDDGQCESYIIGGKQYWIPPLASVPIRADEDSSIVETRQFNTGESIEDDSCLNEGQSCGGSLTIDQAASDQMIDALRHPDGWASLYTIKEGYAQTPYNAGANLERAENADSGPDCYILAKTDGI